MHPCPVIPEHPRDHFILGLADGLKSPAVQTFHFQRAEQSFCTCIIQAIRLAAHRLHDAALLEYLGEFITRIFHPTDQDLSVGTPVLTAAITVK